MGKMSKTKKRKKKRERQKPKSVEPVQIHTKKSTHRRSCAYTIAAVVASFLIGIAGVYYFVSGRKDSAVSIESKTTGGLEKRLQNKDTLFCKYLDLEKELSSVDISYEKIDAILNRSREVINVKDTSSRPEALKALKSIAALIDEQGLKNKEKVGLLYISIREGLLNCHELSALYFSIGEINALPISLVEAPNHSFIRWHLGNGKDVNWETTTAFESTDAQYIFELGITPEQIRKGTYLRSISKEEALATKYLNTGQALRENKRIDKAVEFFDKAINLTSKNKNQTTYRMACFNRGNIRKEMGQYEKAIEDFTEVLNAKPDHHDAYFHRGSAFYKMGKFDMAIEDFEAGLKIAPDDLEANIFLGNAYDKTGNFSKGEEVFRQAISIHPQSPRPRINLGVSLAQQGRLDEAIVFFEEAIGIDPNSFEAHLNAGFSYLQKGDAEIGQKYLRKARMISPERFDKLIGKQK